MMAKNKKIELCENYSVDVKLVQALLKKVGLWSFAADGNFTMKLSMAITIFQNKSNLAETGNILKDSKTIKLLMNTAGGDYARLTSSLGLNCVYVRDNSITEMVVKSNMLWSEGETKKLFAFFDRFKEKYNIPLTVDHNSQEIDENDRASYALETPSVKWLNTAGKITNIWPKELTLSLEKYMGEAGLKFESGRVVSSKPIAHTDATNKKNLKQFKGTNIWFEVVNTDHYAKFGAYKLPEKLKKILINEIDYIYKQYGIPITLDVEDITYHEKGQHIGHFSISPQMKGVLWLDKKSGTLVATAPRLIRGKLGSNFKNNQWRLIKGDTLKLMSNKTFHDQGYTLFLVARRYMSYDSGGIFSAPGHLFVGFINSKGEKKAHGFYPHPNNTLSDRLKYEDKKLKGLVENDIKMFKRALAADSEYRFMKYTVTKQQYDTALSKIMSYDLTYDYGLFERSCVHAAIETLTSAGVLNILTISDGITPYSIYKNMPANRGYKP